MNNAGEIAINNSAPEVPWRTASIYPFPTSMDIPIPAGTDNIIRGINNHADAVGSAGGPGSPYFYAYTNGHLRNLSSAYGMSDASDINDRGDIAGQVGQRGALVRAGGTVELFGPDNTRPTGINNQGAIVGDFIEPGDGIHAYLYADHQFTRLDQPGISYSSASAINDAGAIVGDFGTVSGAVHAFRYADGVMQDLTPMATSSSAADINNDGQIVGTVDGRPFLFANGAMRDLNTLIAPDSGWLLISASNINDRHQILAFACDPTGVFCYTTLRLDPIPAVPEPAGGAMLLAGAALLYVRVRRKMRDADRKGALILRGRSCACAQTQFRRSLVDAGKQGLCIVRKTVAQARDTLWALAYRMSGSPSKSETA